MSLPSCWDAAIESVVHPSWHVAVRAGLRAVHARHPAYLAQLQSAPFLPGMERIFAAFSQPRESVRYILFGEGPYPRAESANGYCFMDGSVDALWSADPQKGFSTRVNRATSLRNWLKLLLVAQGVLTAQTLNQEAIASCARNAREASCEWVQSMTELQWRLHDEGFLLLNASLAYRPDIPALREARPWLDFLPSIFQAFQETALPTLILWGKVAARIEQIPEQRDFPRILAEHPYNLSFIQNPEMQQFFRHMQLLKKFRVEK